MASGIWLAALSGIMAIIATAISAWAAVRNGRQTSAVGARSVAHEELETALAERRGDVVALRSEIGELQRRVAQLEEDNARLRHTNWLLMLAQGRGQVPPE